MLSILIANAKGGVGKTTLATQLAGYYASRGRRVVLADFDKQRSALGWIERRAAVLPRVYGWSGTDKKAGEFPVTPEVLILDSPAGLSGERLKTAVRNVRHVLIPLQPSPFDMAASDAFVEALAGLKQVRKGRRHLAFVANRVHERTRTAIWLREQLDALDLPLAGVLRDTQRYVQMAMDGTTLFDTDDRAGDRDRSQWRSVLDWLGERPED